jgi:hypothetical protein
MLYKAELINVSFVYGQGFWGDESREVHSKVAEMLVEADSPEEVIEILYSDESLYYGFDHVVTTEVEHKKGILMVAECGYSESLV